MLQIKYKGIFLDIQPGQSSELTRNSPLFMLDVLTGEYSTPIIISYSDKNSVSLGHLYFDLTVKAKMKLSVDLYDDYTFLEAATLVIESAGMNRDIAGQGTLTGYLLTGISDFFSLVKGKFLTDLNLGGDRHLVYTTEDPADGSNGYVQQFVGTWQYNDDYVVVPCRNEMFDGNDDVGSQDFMNRWAWTDSLNVYFIQYVVPFPKLQYVLTQIFTEHGWTVDFSGLAGTNWEKLVLFSAYAVQCGFLSDGEIPTFTHLNNITLNLSKAMAQDKLVSYFVMQQCLRYGWVPLANASTRTCRFIALRNVKDGQVKNWTPYAAADVISNFNADPKIYAFKNSFEGDDELPSSADLTGYRIAGNVASFANLPTASSIYDNSLFYSLLENQWFKIDIDPDTNTRIWVYYADNIYDEDIADATDTFDTAVTTLPSYRTEYAAYTNGLFPACRQSRFKKWGIRTLLFLGPQHALNADGTQAALRYPMASSCNLDNQGNKILPWANVYRHIFNNADDGIIQFWFQPWLDIIRSSEEVKRRYYLPRHELLKFQWDDIIVDNNVAYLLKSYVQSLSYQGYIEATMQRIVLGAIKAVDETTGDFVYFHLVIENIDNAPDYTSWGFHYFNIMDGDLVIYCWSDADGTIPFTPSSINVTMRWVMTSNGNALPYQEQVFSVSDQRYVNPVRWTVSQEVYGSDVLHFIETFDYSLVAGTGYDVI